MDSKILTEFSSDMFAETQNSPLIDYYHQPPSYSTQNLSKGKQKKSRDLFRLTWFYT